jgi:hypothetical protein
MGFKYLPEGSFQFFAQLTVLVLSKAGAEEITQGGVVAVAKNLLRKLLGAEGDVVPVEEIDPFLKVEGVAIDEDAVHVEDCSGWS